MSIAKAELAKNIKEQPIGCDAGNPSRKGSCGKEIDKYTDTTLEYWCADFVSWVYAQAGSPFTGGLSGGWRIPGVDSGCTPVRRQQLSTRTRKVPTTCASVRSMQVAT